MPLRRRGSTPDRPAAETCSSLSCLLADRLAGTPCAEMLNGREILQLVRNFSTSVRPVSRPQKVLVEPRLGRPRLRRPAIAPAHQGRQGHQDRLRPPSRLQAEQGSTVPHQIELDVAPAAVELKVALPLAVGRVLPVPQDRQVGRQEAVADTALESEAAVESPFLEVVEEDAADPPGLAAMAEEEVLVAPLLVARVDLRTEGLAGGAGGAMEVDGVLLEAVVGGEIEAAAEPPDRSRSLLLGKKEPHVHV